MKSLSQNPTHVRVQFKTLSSTKLTKHQVVPFKIFYYDMPNRKISMLFYQEKDIIWVKMKSLIQVLLVKHLGSKLDCHPIFFVYTIFGMVQKLQNYMKTENRFILVLSGKKTIIHLIQASLSKSEQVLASLSKSLQVFFFSQQFQPYHCVSATFTI